MLKKSLFVNEDAYDRYNGELHFYIASGVILILCGAIMIIIPNITNNLSFVVSISWLLFLCGILSFIRPFAYGRGFADFVMSLCTGLFYVVAGWSASSSYLQAMENSRFVLSLMLFLTGISCILAFSSLLQSITLPFLVLNGIAEIIGAIFLISGEPNYDVIYIYWIIGILLIISGLDYFIQSKILSHFREKNKT